MDKKQNESNSGQARETVSPRALKIAFLHHVENLPLADAALAAGSQAKTRHSLRSVGWAAVDRAHKNDEIQAEMARQGLTVGYYAQKLKEGCESAIHIKDGDGNLIEVPDNHARHKFVETGIRLLGGFPTARAEVEEMSFEERLFRLEYGESDAEH